MEQFKENVKALREKRGWVQEEQAREIGASLSTMQHWEKQGDKPSRLTRRELMRLFQEAGISRLP